jgi:hypothetical protein
MLIVGHDQHTVARDQHTRESPMPKWTRASLFYPCCGYQCVGVFLNKGSFQELECGGCGMMSTPRIDVKPSKADQESALYWATFALICLFSLLFFLVS